MSLIILGCVFAKSPEPSLQIEEGISTLKTTTGVYLNFSVDSDDRATVLSLLNEVGIQPNNPEFFYVSGEKTEIDATTLWNDQLESHRANRLDEKGALLEWFEGAVTLEAQNLNLAIALFDGSIDLVRVMRFDDALRQILETMASPWDALPNALYVMCVSD